MSNAITKAELLEHEIRCDEEAILSRDLDDEHAQVPDEINDQKRAFKSSHYHHRRSNASILEEMLRYQAAAGTKASQLLSRHSSSAEA